MDTDAITVFSGEVQLLRWAETSTGGATITLALADPADLERFKLMTLKKGQQAGQRLMAVMVEIDENEAPVVAAVPEGFGKAYSALYRAGWFHAPRVLAAFEVGQQTPALNRPDVIKSKIYEAFQVSSLAEINPKEFREWLALPSMGIADTLPRAFS